MLIRPSWGGRNYIVKLFFPFSQFWSIDILIEEICEWYHQKAVHRGFQKLILIFQFGFLEGVIVAQIFVIIRPICFIFIHNFGNFCKNLSILEIYKNCQQFYCWFKFKDKNTFVDNFDLFFWLKSCLKFFIKNCPKSQFSPLWLNCWKCTPKKQLSQPF